MTTNGDEAERAFLIHQIDRSSFVARKQRIFDGIHNHRTMDGGKNPQAKTEPKERNFCFLTFGSAGFPRKSVLTEKKWKNFSHPPTPFALQCGPPSFGLGAGNRGAIRGFSSFFRASKRDSNRSFSEISEKFRASKKFEFLISFWDFSIRDRKFPNRGPRRGSNRFGWKPG